MKTCTYCGIEYPDDATHCAVDGQALDECNAAPTPVAPLTETTEGTLPFGAKPKVVAWFKAYAIGMGLLYFLLILCFPWILAIQAEDPSTPAPAYPEAIIFVQIGMAALSLGFFLPLCFKPRPWTWVYNLVLICFGLSSPCLLPICIPLLIKWIKAETKTYYGRG